MKNIKIINKNKFIRTIIILAILIGAIISVFNNRAYSNTEKKYKTEYVVKGETLWRIAEKEIQENPYFENEDIQNVILEIKRENHMTTSELKEGMELKIPTY